MSTESEWESEPVSQPESEPLGKTARGQAIVEGSLNTITYLATRLNAQLLYGCGHATCRNTSCHTGRVNTSPRPVRRYTPRSARIMAFNILFTPDPWAHLCEQEITPEILRNPPQVPETDGDKASFSQYLADGREIMSITGTHETGRPYVKLSASDLFLNEEYADVAVAANACKYLEQARIPPFNPDKSRRVTFLNNSSAAFYVSKAIDALTRSSNLILQGHNWEEDLQLIDFTLNHHYSVSPNTLINVHDSSIESRARLDRMKIDPIFRVANLLCEVVAYRLSLDAIEGVFLDTEKFEDMLASIMNALTAEKIQTVRIWVKLALLTHWDRNPIIRKYSLARGALEILSLLCTGVDDGTPTSYAITVVAGELNTIQLMKTYINFEMSTSPDILHILQYKFAFEQPQMIEYMRALNLERMRLAHGVGTGIMKLTTTSELASMFGSRNVEFDRVRARLGDLTHEYFLITASRENVLKDSFDQLWRVRRGTLLKPLRVRLREVGTEDYGQDLGGVQAEFFNVMSRQMLSPEYDLFTTNDRTGTSYFKIGSLQPLHMFESLGVLFALALHNGVSMPVSFPLVFYKHIIHLSKGLYVRDQLFDLEEYVDHWPQEIASMQKILESDVTDLALGCAATFEMNGAKFSVIPQSEHGTARIINNQRHHLMLVQKSENASINGDLTATMVDQEASEDGYLDWPGWEVKTAKETIDVTNETKAAFVQWYMHWLIALSVAPQLEAFLRGFGYVYSEHQISLLTEQALKCMFEGTIDIDARRLRKLTSYEGYFKDDPYIKDFWDIVKEWSMDTRRKLLRFVTAAERMPPPGAGQFTFKIETTIDDDKRLPTASTCFSTLQLPRYSCKETLAERLSTAFEFGEYGFGTQ